MALVLIVDDDPLIVDMLTEVVGDYGHTSVTASNGDEALNLALARLPAVIISDVMMPVMDGYALVRAVRETPMLEHTRIFLMSAAFTSRCPPPGEASPDGFVAKPFNLSVIEGLLERLPPGAAEV
jgi:CheY-like chemotaxis protein